MNRPLLVIVALLTLGAISYAQVVPQPSQPIPTACAYNVAPVTLSDGQAGWVQCSANGALSIAASPSASASASITPVVTSAAAANLVVKASAGNLYQIELTSGAAAGYLLVFNSATAPADGTVTPIYCKSVAATSSIELNFSPPAAFATGITASFSTTGCFTKTASATAFISALAK